jgi:hypothetical protein
VTATSELDLLVELVRQRYGNRLTAEQLADVRATAERVIRDVEALRAVRLAATDEPSPAFVPFRAP